MKPLSKVLVVALSIGAFSNVAMRHQSANAQPLEAAENIPGSQLVVAELFTSQGCSSCPAAEDLFSKVAERDNVLTIEWHVDYWDDLVHHGSRWKDPYSKKVFTERQRSYNRSLRGTGAVYTPQAIVNGHFEGVGSRPTAVNDMIGSVPALSVPVKVANNKAIIGPSDQEADILFLRLLERHQTDVKGGENKGRKLHGKNIVLEASVIGTTNAKATELSLPSVGKGETCAILVQPNDTDVGSIIGAAKCG